MLIRLIWRGVAWACAVVVILVDLIKVAELEVGRKGYRHADRIQVCIEGELGGSSSAGAGCVVCTCGRAWTGMKKLHAVSELPARGEFEEAGNGTCNTATVC